MRIGSDYEYIQRAQEKKEEEERKRRLVRERIERQRAEKLRKEQEQLKVMQEEIACLEKMFSESDRKHKRCEQYWEDKKKAQEAKKRQGSLRVPKASSEAV